MQRGTERWRSGAGGRGLEEATQGRVEERRPGLGSDDATGYRPSMMRRRPQIGGQGVSGAAANQGRGATGVSSLGGRKEKREIILETQRPGHILRKRYQRVLRRPTNTSSQQSNEKFEAFGWDSMFLG
jgi:hypothetical protein